MTSSKPAEDKIPSRVCVVQFFRITPSIFACVASATCDACLTWVGVNKSRFVATLVMLPVDALHWTCGICESETCDACNLWSKLWAWMPSWVFLQWSPLTCARLDAGGMETKKWRLVAQWEVRWSTTADVPEWIWREAVARRPSVFPSDKVHHMP